MALAPVPYSEATDMDDNEPFISQVLAGITQADVITIFFPLLRRSLVVDTRRGDDSGYFVGVVPQVGSMEERIAGIERMRPELGHIEGIVGIPWLRPLRELEEKGIMAGITGRLSIAGMPEILARSRVREALAELARIERLAYVRMIRGDGFQTIWQAGR